MIEAPNWCRGCETNCCDHFVLSNWPKWKIDELKEKYPFLSVYEQWVGENERGDEETAWVMECARLMEDGACRDYPDDRPYFCDWAGVRYPPVTGCKLFEKKVKNNPDRCE